MKPLEAAAIPLAVAVTLLRGGKHTCAVSFQSTQVDSWNNKTDYRAYTPNSITAQ